MPTTTTLASESVTGWPFTIRTDTDTVPAFDDAGNSFLARDTSTDSFDTAYGRSPKRVFAKTQSVTDANGVIRTVTITNLVDIGGTGNNGSGGGGTSGALAEGYVGGTTTAVPTGLDMNGRPFIGSVAPIQT